MGHTVSGAHGGAGDGQRSRTERLSAGHSPCQGDDLRRRSRRTANNVYIGFWLLLFQGLTAGQTYVITVEPRRYTISNPVRVVNLLDSLADFDFVADP